MNVYLDDYRPAPEGWALARTVHEAQALLAPTRAQALSLDFDLWTCATCLRQLAEHLAGRASRPPETCPCYETGMQLLVWIAATGAWPEAKPLVHSSNPDGIAAMRAFIDLHWRL